MSAVASQITSVSSVCSTVASGPDQRIYQSFASLAFVRGIHRSPVNSRTKGEYRGKCFHLMASSWRAAMYQSKMIDVIHVQLTFQMLVLQTKLFVFLSVCSSACPSVGLSVYPYRYQSTSSILRIHPHAIVLAVKMIQNTLVCEITSAVLYLEHSQEIDDAFGDCLTISLSSWSSRDLWRQEHRLWVNNNHKGGTSTRRSQSPGSDPLFRLCPKESLP